MNSETFGFFLLAIFQILTTQVSGSSDTYRAAVVEYYPEVSSTDQESVALNTRNYIKYIEEASKKRADIIVFPEHGLQGRVEHPIPDPIDGIIPCDDKYFQTTQTVKDLSRASKENSIYSVVNLLEKRECESGDRNCPSKGYYTLVTNVVFDRRGAVIARYSKYNLFSDNSDRLAEPEISYFDTDFGVRFGTFICFDIWFQSPTLRLVEQYGITDFVFSTYWFSELPFLTAVQSQRGWAESNNVNLLASGANNPARGTGGSGIFNGKYGQIVQIMPDEKTNKLLIANVPKIKSSGVSSSKQPRALTFNETSNWKYNATPTLKTEVKEPELVLLSDQMHLFNSEVISQDTEVYESKVCSRRGFCCDFRVVKDALKPESKNYTLRAVALNGVRKFGEHYRGGVQVCGVLVCDGPHIMNCTNRIHHLTGAFKFKEILVKGNFNLKNSLQIPTTLHSTSPFTPLPANQYEFVKARKGKTYEVSIELLWPKFDLQVFGIWGRDFTRDMEPSVPESGSSSIVAAPMLLGAFLAFVLFAR